MKHYIDSNDKIFAFESDGSQDHLIKPDMQPITPAEIAERNKPTPEEAERLLKGYAKRKRNELEKTGTVTIQVKGADVTFDTDAESLQRIAGASRASGRAVRNGNGNGLTIQWTDANDQAVDMKAGDLEALDDAVVARVQQIHGVYRQVIADIDAGTTTTEVEVDNYPWPV